MKRNAMAIKSSFFQVGEQNSELFKVFFFNINHVFNLQYFLKDFLTLMYFYLKMSATIVIMHMEINSQ